MAVNRGSQGRAVIPGGEGDLAAYLRTVLNGAGDQKISSARGEAGVCPAAVLVPVVVREAGPQILLTRRTDHLQHHPGQISFPGGRVEPEDGWLSVTALRETREEIGLAVERVELLGTLPSFHTGTGFCITPFVGMVHTPFELVLDTFEVAEAFEVPLAHFLDPANHQQHERVIDGRVRQFYAMPYHDYFIWGATAAILRTLYQCITNGSSVR